MFQKIHLNYIVSGALGVVAWIQGTFGTTFYVLAGLLILDFLLNYQYEKYYLEKMLIYLLSAGGAFYLQSASATGPELAKGLIIILAVNELAQVQKSLKAWLQRRKNLPEDQMEEAFDTIDQLVEAITLRLQNPARNKQPVKKVLESKSQEKKE